MTSLSPYPGAPETSPAEEQLYVLVRRALRLWRQFRSTLSAPLEDALGYPSTDLLALAAVADGAATSPGELAAHQGLSAPTASRVVSRLVGAGLLTRSGDPCDQRRQCLEATEAGLALRGQLRREARQLVLQHYGHLPAEQVAAALCALETLEAGLAAGERP